MLMLIIAGLGCKKDPEPEVAAEVDPATSITVRVGQEDVNRVKMACKDTGTSDVAELGEERTVVLTEVTGSDCYIWLMPQEAMYGPVKGGQALNCLIQDDRTKAGCKEGLPE